MLHSQLLPARALLLDSGQFPKDASALQIVSVSADLRPLGFPEPEQSADMGVAAGDVPKLLGSLKGC